MYRVTDGRKSVGGMQEKLKKRGNQTMEKCVFLPQVAFVGGILDVVADIVVHSMGCGAVSGIENLTSKYKTD